MLLLSLRATRDCDANCEGVMRLSGTGIAAAFTALGPFGVVDTDIFCAAMAKAEEGREKVLLSTCHK